MLYRTVIIEDDSVITHLNRRYVEMDNRFCVVQTFSAAHPALFWLRSNPVDLIILDVYMPQMSGLDLLRALRAEGVDADVIMVTSADDATAIEAFMRLGVTDYLIKPFGYERFQLALKTFCQRRNAIHSGNLLDHVLGHKFLCAVITVPAARRDVSLHREAGPGGSPDFLGLFLLGVGNRQPGQHQSGNGKKQTEHQQGLFPFSRGM